MKAEIYTNMSCPHCVRAKEILKQQNIPFVEYTVGKDGITKETIETKIGDGTTVRTVPQIFLDGKYVGGCSELKAMFGVS